MRCDLRQGMYTTKSNRVLRKPTESLSSLCPNNLNVSPVGHYNYISSLSRMTTVSPLIPFQVGGGHGQTTAGDILEEATRSV